MSKSRRTSDLVNSIFVNPDNSVNIHEGTESPYFLLTTTATPTPQQGMLFWDADRSTVGLQMNGVEARLAQDNFWYVKNQTGSPIPKGTAVMAVGALGASSRILVAPMIADGSVDEQYFLGITAEEILDGADGFVTNIGKIRGIDTSVYGTQAGQILYCDPANPGGFTITQPQAPNLNIPAAFTVDYKSNGTIAVRALPGYHLSELHDVYINTPSDQDILLYNGTNSRWENTPISTAVPTPTLDAVTTSGNTTTNSITVGSLLVSSSTGGTAPWFTPTATLQGTNPGFYMQNTGTGGGFGAVTVGNTTGNLFFSFSSTKDFTIQSTNGTSFDYRFSIKPTGNVLIGTNTDAGYKLDVNGSALIRDYTQIINSNSWTSASDAFTLVLPNTPNPQNSGHAIKVRRNATVKLSDKYGDSPDVGLHVNYFNTSLNAYFGRNYSNLASTGLGVANNSSGTHDFTGSINSGITTGGLVHNNGVGSGLCVIERYNSNNYTAATDAVTYGVYSISTTINLTTNGAYKRWVGGYFSAQPSYSVNNDNAVSIGVWGNAQGGQFNYAGLFTGGNVGIGITSPSYLLHVQGTLSAQLTNATHTNQVYYNTSTGELTYGALPTPATPTLDAVTTAGNTTSNAITVGKTTIIHTPSNGGYVFRAESDRARLDLIHPGGGTARVQITSTGNSGFIKEFIMTDKFKISTQYFGNAVYFGNGSTTYTIFTNTNNFAIGTTTDSGYKLDVNGTARVSGNLTVDTNTLFVDAANNRVGIGTTTPTSNLEIVQTQNGNGSIIGFNVRDLSNIQANFSLKGGTSATQPSLLFSSLSTSLGGGIGGTALIQNLYDSNNFYPIRFLGSIVDFETTASSYSARITAMRIFSSSNVGINTTTDAGYKLDVNGTFRATGNADFSGDIDANEVRVKGTVFARNIADVYTLADGALESFNIVGYTLLRAGGQTGLYLENGFGEPNKAGIWTSTPQATLDVNGTFRALLTNATHSNAVYYDTTTGELTYGALPTPATPTLDAVTTAGNTTTNNITIQRAFPTLFLDHQGSGTLYGGGTIVLKNNLFYSAPLNTSISSIALTDSFNSAKASISFVKDTTDSAIDFASNRFGTSTMRLKDTGNVLVGTTTDNGLGKLQVEGAITATQYVAAGQVGQTIDIPTGAGQTLHFEGGILTSVI